MGTGLPPPALESQLGALHSSDMLHQPKPCQTQATRPYWYTYEHFICLGTAANQNYRNHQLRP